MKTMIKTNLPLAALISLWVLAIVIGTGILMKYEFTPCLQASSSEIWPAKSSLKFNPTGFTLVLFAHPKCPCTQATIAELSRLLAQCRSKPTTYVLFTDPADHHWGKTDLYQSAVAIPGVKVLNDLAGAESCKFKAETSGQTLLYNQYGRLIFRGGITASRGQEGDNPGFASIIDLLQGKPSRLSSTAVFGCGLVKQATQ